MHQHELLALAQATYQSLFRALPTLHRLHTMPGFVWAVGQHAIFQVTVWRKLVPGVLPQPEANTPGAQPLLVTEYVEDAMGEQLREEGICYLDLAGNTWLQHPAARELCVLIQGRPRYRKPVKLGMAFRRDGLRLLFHVLTQPQVLAYDDARLAAHVGLTPHVLTTVLTDLEAQGLLTHEPRQLTVSPGLVERWVNAYGPSLRPRLNPERYRWLDPAQAANWRELPLGRWSAWSGEAAAQLLLGECGEQPSQFIIYSAENRANLCNRLGLRPHPQGKVELLRPFSDFYALPQAASSSVHPLVAYADLLLTQTLPAAGLAQRLAHQHLADLMPAGFTPSSDIGPVGTSPK